MRVRFEPWLMRVFSAHNEIAYISVRRTGIGADVETPSDWHESRRMWFHVSALFVTFAWSLPWFGRVPPDDGQCEGPKYGIRLDIDDGILWIYHGKSTSRKGAWTTIKMPWHWRYHASTRGEHGVQYSYRYERTNGEVQDRVATVRKSSMEWRRYWLPWRKVWRGIDVDFDGEVGEGTGSWKGGTVGCSYESRPGETPVQTLRRMERERRF